MKKKISSRIFAAALATVMSFALSITPSLAVPATDSPGDAGIDYLRLHNHVGPSGVPLGGAGVGYYEISPEGKFTRNCINNIHKSFIDSPAGMFLAVSSGGTAARLQRDASTVFGMQAYNDSYYTGLFPRLQLDFANPRQNGAPAASFNAFSGVVAHNVKDSSLPVVWYEVTLTNESDAPKNMSAMISWADLIGRGIKDTTQYNNANFNPDGESSYWRNMNSPATTAENVTVGAWKGVKQSSGAKIMPSKMTFQNYNTDFLILAEESAGTTVSVLKRYSLTDSGALSAFTQNGAFAETDGKVALSPATNNANNVSNASAVAVATAVPAHQSKKVKFIVTWFMPEYSPEDMALIPSKAPNSDYNKYYHNFFSSAEEIALYAQQNGERIYNGVNEWQTPILNSNLPDFMKFKEINSAYTLFTNGVLNKRENFTTLEGEMGGYGGTMDQKMSSHVMYEKLFPELNLNENRQFANVLGANGEIQHFDVHYYVGMSDSDAANKYNPTPNGSMIDNAGAWMVQMLNYYKQTGDDTYLRLYYDVVKASMAFIQSKCPAGVNIPNYNTTYDDYSHPEILIFSGTVYMNMLDIAAQIAAVNNDPVSAAGYRAQLTATSGDVQKLYVNRGNIGYYSFGSDAAYISSNKQSGEIKDNIMFSGAMAGQFISRYSGNGDIIPFGQYVSHMKTFLTTSIQETGDYYAPKVFDMSQGIGLDNQGSRCWPFYLDSYGAMAAIQAGYVEDGLEIMEHTQLVHFRSGYTWTQNLWNPAYSTYMTAPVVWFINDIMAGSAIDAAAKTLTLGPSVVPGAGKLVTPLYYPKFWAEFIYDPAGGTSSYRITKTFYEQNEAAIRFENLVIAPNGAATSAKTLRGINFTVVQGSTLDLSAYMSEFAGGAALPKNLTPMPKYNPNQAQTARAAAGTGLTLRYYDGLNTDKEVYKGISTEVNYNWTAGQKPPGVTGDAYTAKLSGYILPRYGQTYELRFVAKGSFELTFDGRKIGESEFRHTTQNGSISLLPGSELYVYTTSLNANQLYPLEFTYKNADAANGGVLGFMWWSTTQTPEYVISSRLYPEMSAYETIRAYDYSRLSGNLRQTDDCIDYIENNNWIIYPALDFGSDGLKSGSVQLMIGGPANDVCNGGTVEVRQGSSSGKLLTTVTVGTTSGWSDYKPWRANISLDAALTGKQDICLVFKCPRTFLGNLSSLVFSGAGAPLSAYNTIPVSAYSAKSGRATLSGDGSCMEYVEKDNWIAFDSIDFGDGLTHGYAKVEAAAINDSANSGGIVEVRLDAPDGPLMAQVTIEVTGSWSTYNVFSTEFKLNSPISGIHAVYYVAKPNRNFVGNIRAFVFEKINALSAYETIPAVDYADKFGRVLPNGDKTNMEYIENNNWLMFKLDFGGGLEDGVVGADTAVLASGNCNGGTIVVRAGSPTGDVIARIPVSPTAGWGDYRRFSAPFSLNAPLSGIQDIYFVFSPNLTFLGNIRSFHFQKSEYAEYSNGDVSIKLRSDSKSLADASGKALTFDVIIRNRSELDLSYLALVCLYDKRGALLKTETAVISTGSGAKTNSVVSVDIPAISSGLDCKLYVWDAGTYVPITTPFSVS